MTQEDAIKAHDIARQMDLLAIWTVYQRPSDYPEGFVARMHVVSQGKVGPTNAAVFADTLKGVRELLPPGLIQMARHEQDEPQIVETWM